MVDNLINKEDNKLLKQRLQRVHQAIGVFFALFLYVIIFFGLLAIVLPYINPWAKPSNHIAIADSTKIEYEKFINHILEDSNYPNITIILPEGGQGYFNGDRTLRIRVPFSEDRLYNPNNYKQIEHNLEDVGNHFAWFLNSMHYFAPLGQYFAYGSGLVATAGIFLIIGGILLLLKIKYTNNGKNSTSKFSKYHRKIFIWVSLPFFIILLSGALAISFPTSNLMIYMATKGEESSIDKMHNYPNIEKPKLELKNEKTSMLAINELLIKAKEVYPHINITNINLENWGDSSAVIKFDGYNPYRFFVNKFSITLSAVDGTILEENYNTHWVKQFTESWFFLHYLFSANDILRIFMFFVMSFCAVAIGFGVLLDLEKKARKFQEKVPVYQGFGKVALAVMIGVIPAVSVYFASHWILPFDMENRAMLQQWFFALTWCATLTWSFYRINSYQASKEFLYFGGILFALTPIFHFIKMELNPIDMFFNIGKILAVDVVLFLFGLALVFVAYKLPTNREKIKEFWTARGVK